MTKKPNNQLSPERWAFQVSHILNTVLGKEHFPVNIKEVAKEYSRQIDPDEPITLIKGESLPGFEGGLFNAPEHKRGWGILYNKDITSPGRINYTIAHEFGHYLIHKAQYPEGIRCGEQDLYRWESDYRKIEYEANIFAATLLMPLDDYRRQISPSSEVDLDSISNVSERYGVSFLAAALRWIQYTELRSVLVVSRDGYILWARSSKSAFRSGAFFRTSNVSPIEVPASSLAACDRKVTNAKARQGLKHSEGIWFNESCQEMAVFSNQYDLVFSLIQLAKTPEISYNEMRVKEMSR